MSSNTIERPEDGTIEEMNFDGAGIDIVTYSADSDGAAVIEIEYHGLSPNRPIRVYVNGKRQSKRKESVKLCPYCDAVAITAATADGATAWLCSTPSCDAGASIGDDGELLRELQKAKHAAADQR